MDYLFLEKREAALFSGFEIVFDELTDQFSFMMPEIHGFVVGQSTAHVPTHLDSFIADALRLLFHAIDQSADAVRVQGQEAGAKKRAESMVKACSYRYWHPGQVILSGRSSLYSRSATA